MIPHHLAARRRAAPPHTCTHAPDRLRPDAQTSGRCAMFCTACATVNPRTATTCGGCGVALGSARQSDGIRRRRRWRAIVQVGTLNLALALLLPLAGAA